MLKKENKVKIYVTLQSSCFNINKFWFLQKILKNSRDRGGRREEEEEEGIRVGREEKNEGNRRRGGGGVLYSEAEDFT